jgi:hypothetical protein
VIAVLVIACALAHAAPDSVAAQSQRFGLSFGVGMELLSMGGDFDGSTTFEYDRNSSNGLVTVDNVVLPDTSAYTMYTLTFGVIIVPFLQTATIFRIGTATNSYDNLTFAERQESGLIEFYQEGIAILYRNRRFKAGGYGNLGYSVMIMEATARGISNAFFNAGSVSYYETTMGGIRYGLGLIAEFDLMTNERFVAVARAGWSGARYTSATAGGASEVSMNIGGGGLSGGLFIEWRFNAPQ